MPAINYEPEATMDSELVEKFLDSARAIAPFAGVMASLRSLAISLLRLDGQANIAAANRHHARDPQRTLKLLQTA
jgi:hypothetical protein